MRTGGIYSFLTGVILVLFLSLGMSGIAWADTIVVTNNGDSGLGTLRQAIIDAEDDDIITFNLSNGSETIEIESELEITDKSLTINGANMAGSGTCVTVRVPTPGGSPWRVFNIDAADKTVNISNMAVNGGSVTRYGGAIYFSGSTLKMDAVTVSGSKAYYAGGGIYVSGTATLTNCTISGNTAEGFNQIGSGGGIYVSGTATLTNCTVSGNTAGGSRSRRGGGIFVSGTATLTNCTVSGNTADLGGGGIYQSGGHCYLLNSIVVNNSAPDGGDVYVDVNSDAATAYYTWYGDAYGTISGNNLAPNNTDAYTAGDLGPLEDNGGPTQTMAVLNSSCPAVFGGAYVYYNAAGGYYYFLDNDNNPHKLTDWDNVPTVQEADKITTDQRGALRQPTSPTIGAYTFPTYRVTYDGNGNTSGKALCDSNAYQQGEKVEVLDKWTLVKTGHTFKNWNTAANGGGAPYNPGDSFNMPGANVTLYAQWTANEYTVTFDANGGSTPVPEEKSVTYGETYGDLATTSHAGYTFAGWFTVATGGTQVTSSTPVDTAENHRLYAHWSINVYSLTTTANPAAGGTVTKNPDKVQYEHGEQVELTANANAHYTFTDWSGALTGSNNPATLTMDEAKSVTANFAPTYRVTYNGNGNTGGESPTDDKAYQQGDEVTVLDKGTLVKTDATFSHWNTTPDGSGTSYNPGEKFDMPEANVTLYAQWSTCQAVINPTNVQYGPEAMADRTVAVTIDAVCQWTAASNNDWISITDGTRSTGKGTVTYRVAENGSQNPPRTGTMTIAGETCTVVQGTADAVFAEGPAAGCRMQIERTTGGPYALSMDSGEAGGTLPVDTTFPWGLMDFKVVNVPQGGTIRMVFTMTENISAGSVFYKFDAQTGAYTPYGNVEGLDDGDNTFVLILTDGGEGDQDGIQNGEIVDPGNVGVTAAPIPTLSEWGMILFILLMAAAGIRPITRRRNT